MGIHFDGLVEFTRRLPPSVATPHTPSLQAYLEGLLNEAALFDLPLLAEEIFARSGKDHEEYSRYVANYFDMSRQYGTMLLTPFPKTAIEDRQSVVLLDNVKDNEYFLTSCSRGDVSCGSIRTYCSYTKLGTPTPDGMPARVTPMFHCMVDENGEYDYFDVTEAVDIMAHDTHNATTAYIAQLVYIMDPDNFIIRKENKQCPKNDGKIRYGHRAPPLRKTIMRPHYVCLGETDLRSFITGESREPMPAHPVRGHWKRLMSPRFVNKKGQRIFVGQYLTGQGEIIGRNGWKYKVMVKEGPDKLVPYERVQKQSPQQNPLAVGEGN